MANVKAQVELTGSLSLTVRGRTYHQGKPVTLTNPAEIAHIKTQRGFNVVVIGEDKPVKAGKGNASLPPAKGKAKSAPPPPPDEDDDEDEESEEDDEDAEDGGENEDEEEADVGDDGSVSDDVDLNRSFNKTELEKLSKPVLVALAKKKFDEKLDVGDRKPELVKKILKLQIEAAKAAKV